MKAIEKLEILKSFFDFRIEIYEGEYDIVVFARDEFNTPKASVNGYTVFEDAVQDLLSNLQEQGYGLNEVLIEPTQEDWDYEYNVREPRGMFEVGTWIPIKKERIKRPENIEKYIQMGVLREYKR